MFQAMVIASSIVLSVAAIGGSLVIAGNSDSSSVLKVWREPQGWATPALGSYNSTGNGTVSFRDGIATRAFQERRRHLRKDARCLSLLPTGIQGNPGVVIARLLERAGLDTPACEYRGAVKNSFNRLQRDVQHH